jgi:hypothetical protein
MDEIDCPRARSFMTPCIARDGTLALAGDGQDDPYDCVGCGAKPRPLLLELAQRYKPARRYIQTKDARACATRFKQLVADYVEAKEPNEPPSKPTTRIDR